MGQTQNSYTREVKVLWVKMKVKKKNPKGDECWGNVAQHLPFEVTSTEFSDGASAESGATEYMTDIHSGGMQVPLSKHEALATQTNTDIHMLKDRRQHDTLTDTYVYIYIQVLVITHCTDTHRWPHSLNTCKHCVLMKEVHCEHREKWRIPQNIPVLESERK